MNRYLDIFRAKAQELAISVAMGPVLVADSDASGHPCRTTTLGRERLEYSIWDGQKLSEGTVAIDTETAPIRQREIPELAVVSVSDGHQHHLIHPGHLSDFLQAHRDAHFVAHNAAFDFWVVERYLGTTGMTDSRDSWWAMADDGRLHDTMLLDQLIRLGRADELPRPRDLSVVARQYARVDIDKTDPFRLRYGEIIGKNLNDVEAGFLEYAIKDAVATQRAFTTMRQVAKQLISGMKDEVLPDSVQRFGYLTETLQVRGAIALAALERTGLQLDTEAVETVQQQLRSEIAISTANLQSIPIANSVFKVGKDGAVKLAPKSRAPCVDKKKLTDVLGQIAEESEETIEIPRTAKTNKLTTSVKFWSRYRHIHPFIGNWVELSNIGKLHQFFAGLQGERIYPRYTPLVRTGRTSCTHPNIQQLPRSAGFREMVVATPGHYLFAIDYSAIELRVLAAICEHRYGESELAEVIRRGTDAHGFTGAMFEGMQPDDFLSLKTSEPDRFSRLRQQAKALNFGIPGGLGAASLVSYAASTYGVEISLDEAQAFREKLINDVYPELALYLYEDPLAILADNLGADVELVRRQFKGAAGVRNVVRGRTEKLDGTPYNAGWYERVWQDLNSLNTRTDLADQLASRTGGESLYQRLFWAPVVTLTGRLRGRVSYSQARNTPFQGLAADGAKLALWKLTMAGYRCVAFVHDEVLIELPIDADHAAEARRIDEICCNSMEQLTGCVPIACEYALAHSWSKGAVACFSDNGDLIPWEADQHR